MARSKKKVAELAKKRPLAPSPDFFLTKRTIRIGVEYQADITTGSDENERSDLFRFGLPIPVTWVNGEKDSNLQSEDKGLLPIPTSSGESLSLVEHGSFLLGLYVFGQNFRLVNEFMGNKGMGNILSYYYGDFYKSPDYNRWSKWKNDKQRMPKYASNIFTGLRNEELISRLSANVTNECKESLVQAGKDYLNKRVSLQNFIFTLKDKVGVNTLVEAVALGQDGRDLLQFPISCNFVSVIEEVPTGNKCSSLTKQDIISILRGGERISKAKSRDLFWEDVWPRLLARGWSRVMENSKSMVFVPDIVAYVNGQLEKGIHYFDSIIDVLSKVAQEPELLEPKSDQDKLVDPDMNQESENGEQYVGLQRNQDFEMLSNMSTSLDCGVDGISVVMEGTSSSYPEPAFIAKQGPDKQMVTDMNHYSDNEVQNFQSEQELKALTSVDASLNHYEAGILKRRELTSLLDSEHITDISPYNTSRNEGGVQEKMPSANKKNEEIKEEPSLKKKHNHGTVIDLTLSQMDLDSDSGKSSLSPKSEANQTEISSEGDNSVQQPVMMPQRHSMRNRMLTTKALEAFAFGYLRPKRKHRSEEETTPRQVRGKTDPASVDGAGDVE